MKDSLTQVLERSAGSVPPAPDVSQLVEAGKRRRRRSTAAVLAATAAGLAVVVGGITAVWPFLPPAQDAVILDQPTVPYEPWRGQEVDVDIFLCDDPRCPSITTEQQADLRAQLVAEPVVEAVYFESKEDAYERFAEQFAEQPELVESMDPGILPASFRVKLTDPGHFAVIEERFSTFPGVEEIIDRHREVPAIDPMPDAETVAAEISMVEVTPDGQWIDLYIAACGRQASLVEFEQTPTEIRARFVRTTDQDPVAAGCTGSRRVELDEPLDGRPIIDLNTGDPVEDVTDLPRSDP